MFSEKTRHWITGPYYKISFSSWNEWMHNRPDTKVSWKSYKPFNWNIKDDPNGSIMQILYMKLDGQLDINAIFITVKPEDEVYIREWLDEQPWVHK